MAEIGVLSLQIKSETTEAENGLKRLEGALLAVKDATKDIGLSKVAGALKRINQAINEDSIDNLNKLAEAMNKVREACDFTIPNFSGLKRIKTSMDSTGKSADAMEKIDESSHQMAEGFSESEERLSILTRTVSEYNEALQNASRTETDIAPDITAVRDAVDPMGKFRDSIVATANDTDRLREAYKNMSAEDLEKEFYAAFEMAEQYRKELLGIINEREELEKSGSSDTLKLEKLVGDEESARSMADALYKIAEVVSELWENAGSGAQQFEEAVSRTGQVGTASVEELKQKMADLRVQMEEAKQKWFEMGEASRAALLAWAEGTERRSTTKEELANLKSTYMEASNQATIAKQEYQSILQEMSDIAAATGETLYSKADLTTTEERYVAMLDQEVIAQRQLAIAAHEYESNMQRAKAIANLPEKDQSLILKNATDELRQLVDSAQNVSNVTDAMIRLNDEMVKVKDAAGAIIDKLNEPINLNWSNAIDQMMGIDSASKSAQDSMAVFLNSMAYTDTPAADQIRELNPELASFAEEMRDAGITASGELLPSLVDLDGELKSKKTDVEEVKTGFERFKDSLASAKGVIKGLFSPLTRLGKQFYSIARRMAIRGIIRQFTQGIKTGLENVYNYSKAIKSQFATSMDDAASSLLTMKNSLGAALAPALQALIPILQTVVNWFINMMNYVNQFIALINGQNSWIKAVPATTTAFGKEEKAAKKAGNAIKDLLADWDELNIIQSESGGSGSGAGETDAEKALKMFETMNTFDQKVQEVVAAIKENFDSILGLVGDIGLAIGMWKVASGLTGILSTLAYIVGAGAIVVIEFKISEFLNRKFFETGEDGYLIASALTALVGGFFMKGMLENVLKGQLAHLTIPFSLLVDATARTLVELGETDVSALSREAIKANIASALEVGGAAAYLAYTSGYALGQSLAGGAVVAITTFGVLTNLKADVDAVRNNAISEETIKAKALGSLLVSIGAATAAKLLVPGATMGQVMGFGAATGASMFLLTLSATLAITATTEAAKSGITMNTLYSDLGASLSAAVGSALVLKMVTNNSWQLVSKAGAGIGLVVASALIGIQATTQAVRNNKITTDTIIQDAIASLGMGAGIAIIAGTIGKKTLTSALGIGGAGALITLGALIGIQAAVQAAKNGEVTTDTIISYATSSLAVGAGVAILGATIGGLGTGIAVLGGGLAALAMFGALFAVQAILRPAAKDTIQWGDRKLTEQEVQDYVNTQIFDVNLPVAINLVKGKMEDANAAQSKLKNKIADVQPVVNKLILGFDIPGSLKELDDEIFGENGLLASYNETIKGKKAEIEAALVLVPIKDDQGNDMSAEYLKGISAGWTNIDTIMSNLGKSLADTMKDAYTGQLKENLSDMEKQSITEITKTMLELATIISSSEAEIKMKREFSQGLANVSGFSIEEIIGYYKSQKDSAKKTMEDVYNVYLDDLAAQKMANEKLLELAEKNGGEYAGQSVEYYKGEIERINELYDGLLETRDKSIQLALEFYTNGEGLEQVRKAIIDALSNQELNWTYTGNTEDLNGVLGMIMQQAESGSTAMFGSMITYFRNVIKESVTNPEALLNAFDLGLVGFQDIFSDKEIDKIYDMFADMFGEDEQNQEAYGRVRMALDRMFGRTPADAWEDIELYIEDMLDGKWGESDIDEQIKEVMDTLKRMYGDDYLRKIFSEYSENFSDISDEFTKWLQDNGYTLTIEVAVDESSAKDAEQRLNEITAGTGAEDTVTRGFFRANAINANNAYVVSGVSGSGEGDMSDDVEKGTRAANAGIESQINTLIQLLRANLNRGSSTVTFIPTSAMGRGVTEALTAWGNVTG